MKTSSNYYLTGMKSSIHVILDIKTEVSASVFRSVLSFCKQWNVKNIILKLYDLNNVKLFDQLYHAISDTFLFSSNDFNFYIQYENLERAVIREFWKNNQDPKEFLLPFITHNSNFENQFSSFGTDIYRFFNYKPEIISIGSENKKISHTFSFPDNIFALFVTEHENKNFELFEWIDLNKYFNAKSGKLIYPWKINKKADIIVFRKIFGFIDNNLNQKLNFFSEKILDTYLKFLDDSLNQNSTFFKGIYLQPFNFNSLLENTIAIDNQFEKSFNQTKGKDFFQKVLNFWYKSKNESHLHSADLFNFIREQLIKTCKTVYEKHIKSNDKKLIFEISDAEKGIFDTGIPLYLFDFASVINDFCIFIDSMSLVPNGIFSKQKEVEIRIVSSINHHYESSEAKIKCGKFLNTKNSFTDKLWYFNWLVSCGANEVIQDIVFDSTELKINLYNNLPTLDPSYFGYKNWFKYIQTLIQFASKGIHRCDILILYPIESFYHNNFIELYNLLPDIANEGLDYDLIDYNGFVNKDTCKIFNKYLKIKNEKYAILILPGVETIPVNVIRKINEFYQAGGIVIAIGNLPSRSTNWDEDNEVESISNEIWFKKSSISSTKFKTNKWGGKGYFQSNINLLPDIINENSRFLNVKLQSDKGRIRLLVKEMPTEYYILLFNMSLTEDYIGKIQSKYKGKPYLWDYKSESPIEIFDFVIKDSYLHFSVSVSANQSKIIIIKKQSIKSLPKVINTNINKITNINIKNQKIRLIGKVNDKGTYKAEISLFNVSKFASITIKNFLPTLTISHKNWNIEFNNKKIIDNLGDLSRYDHTFHGAIIYKKIIIIPEEYLSGYKLYLDLGKLKDTVEIHINGSNVGLYIFPPFRIDISDYVISGDNKFQLKIRNNLSNALSSLDNAENNKFYIKEYGLWGPVKIIPYKEIELTC